MGNLETVLNIEKVMFSSELPDNVLLVRLTNHRSGEVYHNMLLSYLNNQ